MNYLRNKINGNIQKNLSFTNFYDKNIWEVWEPKFEEWCLFYNDNSKSYRIAQFKQIATGKNRAGLFKDIQGNYFTNCKPFDINLIK